MKNRSESRRQRYERRKKRKESKKRDKSSFAKLVKKVRADDPEAGMIIEPAGVPKMSEVLLDFAQPLLEHAKDDNDFKTAISLAAISWNTASVPASKRKGLIEEAASSMPEVMDDETLGLINTMVERKDSLFSHINRFIVNFDFSTVGTRITINVASTETPT